MSIGGQAMAWLNHAVRVLVKLVSATLLVISSGSRSTCVSSVGPLLTATQDHGLKTTERRHSKKFRFSSWLQKIWNLLQLQAALHNVSSQLLFLKPKCNQSYIKEPSQISAMSEYRMLLKPDSGPGLSAPIYGQFTSFGGRFAISIV